MDQFGIGAAIKGSAHVYFQSARQTGRTTQLIESLKDGDRVVFKDGASARHFEILTKEHDKKIEVIVVSPKNTEKLFETGTSEGRTVFDHSWVEQYYLNTIERAALDIDYFQRETSGFGAAHIETRMKFREQDKWRV